MKSKLKYLMLFVLLSLSLVACNNASESEDNTATETTEVTEEKTEATDSTEATEESEDSEATKEAKDSENKKIVLYSNTFADEKITWLEEKSSEAGFDLEIVFIPGGDLLQRLIAEKNDPQADVVIGLDEGGFSELKDNDMIIAWDPEWKKDIDEELIYGDGYFYPWAEQRIFNFYDGNQMDAEEAPKSYEELATEKFDGQYSVPGNLSGSTNQKVVFTMLLQYLDENGELGVSKEGWKLVEDYYKYGYIAEAEDNIGSLKKAIAMLKDGDLKVSYYFSGGLVKAEKEFGVHAVPINPEYGVFTMAEQVGIMNHGDDADYEKATEFAEWWGQADVQKAWAEDFGTVPANNEAKKAVDPRVLELFEQTDRMELDWKFLNEHLDEWVEKIELDIMP